MAITNRDRVGKALEILGDGLAPFVERELKAVLGDQVARRPDRQAQAGARAGRKRLNRSSPIRMSCSAPCGTSGTMSSTGPSARPNGASSASCGTSATAGRTTKHFQQQRRLPRPRQHGPAAHRPSRPPQAAEVGQMRMDLLRVQFDEQRRSEMRKNVVPADRRQAARRPEAVARSRHAAS